jgi:hypothetical protein
MQGKAAATVAGGASPSWALARAIAALAVMQGQQALKRPAIVAL